MAFHSLFLLQYLNRGCTRYFASKDSDKQIMQNRKSPEVPAPFPPSVPPVLLPSLLPTSPPPRLQSGSSHRLTPQGDSPETLEAGWGWGAGWGGVGVKGLVTVGHVWNK